MKNNNLTLMLLLPTLSILIVITLNAVYAQEENTISLQQKKDLEA